MKNKKWLTIEIKADGNSGMIGGAYSHVFVYSNKGNFLLKGYLRECEEYLKELVRDTGLKYFASKTLFFDGKSRDIWEVSDERIGLYGPSPDLKYTRKDIKEKWSKENRKFKIRFKPNHRWDSETLKEFRLKRLPKKWVPELFDFKTVTESL